MEALKTLESGIVDCDGLQARSFQWLVGPMTDARSIRLSRRVQVLGQMLQVQERAGYGDLSICRRAAAVGRGTFGSRSQVNRPEVED